MNCHVEWIRNFLLRNSTISPNYISYIRANRTKSSPYSELSALRYQLLKPGFTPFIDHTFYSLTISIIDFNFSYENSNFSIIRSYLLQYLPCVNVSITELESKQFSSSHYTLCKSILTYYIRFYLKPSTISPTCFGLDIEAYEKSLYEWGRSICKGEIPYLPGNFMIDFGTAQVVSIILSKIHPELIQLSRITFSERLSQSEIVKNWREVGTALNVIGVHVPTEKEWGDNLCLLCFGVDLFKAIYNKTNSSNLVEFQMKQNQINQQNNYQRNNNYNNGYCANNELNKIDFLIGQMNSISNGNPNILLSEPYQQNPILVQEQRILQYQRQQQQLLQIQQQQEIQQLNNQYYQPQISYNYNNEIDTNPNPVDSRIRIVSANKQEKNTHHLESKKIESHDKRRNIDDDLIYQRAKKYKLLKEFKSSEKQKENKKTKKSKESIKTDKNESVQNFKIMSSFAIDPSFPNQCKLTTYKEAIDSKNLHINENQFKQLQKFDKFEQKKKRKISPDSSIKCSYVTFDNDNNQNDQISSQKFHEVTPHNSKRKKNHHKHHQDSIIKKNSLFDDVIEADKPDLQNPKTSQDFQNIISKQKEEFKKKNNSLSGNKSGTDLLTSINSFIEQQREAIAAASLAKKIENSKIKAPEPLPDFSQFDVTQPESIKVFDTDPILLINSKLNESQKDNRNNKKNAKNSEVTSQSELSDKNKNSTKLNNKSSSSSSSSVSVSGNKEKPKTIDTQIENKNDSSFSDPLLIEFFKKDKNKNHSHSSSSIKSNSSSSSSKKIESGKQNHFNESNSIQKVKNDSEMPSDVKNKTDSFNVKLNDEKNSINQSHEIEQNSNEFIEEEEEVESSETEKPDFVHSNKNISQNISNIKNSSRMDDFSMKSELTFPDIPSLIDPSFKFDQIQNEEKQDKDKKQDLMLNKPTNSSNLRDSSKSDKFNKLQDSQQSSSKIQNSNKLNNSNKFQNSEQEKSDLHESNRLQNSEQNSSKIHNSTNLNNSNKLQNSEQISSKLNNSNKLQNSEQEKSDLYDSNKLQNSEQISNKIQNSSKLNNSNKFQNSEQEMSDLHDSNKLQNSEQNTSKIHNSTKSQNSEQTSIKLDKFNKTQNSEQNSNKIQNTSNFHDSAKSQNLASKSNDINSSLTTQTNEKNSEKELFKEQSSDAEKKSFSNKRPIPLPHSPLASPNSTNFFNSSSKLPFSTKLNGQKSESMTPPELSIVSGFEIDSVSHKHESESLSKPSNKSLNDDNDLSIDQNSSEIKTNASNSNVNSDSFGQSMIKKISINNSDSKQTNSILENSQSSNKVESAVEEFIPEIERFSSSNEQKKKMSNKSSESSQNNDNKSKIKKFHSSSSSSDSIPFKVLHSDSEKNQIENNRKSEEDINDNFERKEDSKPFTSVIEEFDLSSIKPSKRKQIPIQSTSGPIILNEEPIPKGNPNKGPSSETRRVSFSLGIKGFAPPQSNQFSTSANIPKLNKNYSSTTNSSLNFNDNDIDTFMSTASMTHSLSIPIEERLKMYSKDHNELSLPFSDPEPEVIQEYKDVSTANVGKKYIWLSKDEQALLENILPAIVAKPDIQDINTFISKELKIPKNNSSVHRIAANIKAFLLSRGKEDNS